MGPQAADAGTLRMIEMNYAPNAGSSPSALRRYALTRASIAALFLASTGATARAQVNFSIDWHGPTKSAIASTPAIPITEGDILRPPPGAPAFGPLANPTIAFTGGQLGLSLYSNCQPNQGHPCRIEVDALSYATDYRFQNGLGPSPTALTAAPALLWYSVDEFAVSFAEAVPPPSIRSESAAPVFEAGADVFTTPALPVGPLPPGAVSPPTNVGVLDGNGLVSLSGFKYRGVGLEEPNPPGLPPDAGDNLDALTIGPTPSGPLAAIYFSLDASFIDPLLGVANSGSAAAAGFPPGAVLRKLLAGGGPTVWATPAQLGLDLQGPGTDDLDALVLWDNGNGVFNPSATPYDWATGAKDMLLFSVRRGSAVIGTVDSIFGIPIEPGDLLTTPPTSGAAPGIFIAAENLGLATSRTQGAAFGDDMDAAATIASPGFDCNHNDVEDAIDISNGTSSDNNKNGIPDECERRRILVAIPK